MNFAESICLLEILKIRQPRVIQSRFPFIFFKMDFCNSIDLIRESKYLFEYFRKDFNENRLLAILYFSNEFSNFFEKIPRSKFRHNLDARW